MKMVTLEFSHEQLALINAALMEVPYRLAAPVIGHINGQIQKAFDRSVDERDLPSGAAAQTDQDV